jgi:hypothetical protein
MEAFETFVIGLLRLFDSVEQLEMTTRCGDVVMSVCQASKKPGTKKCGEKRH